MVTHHTLSGFFLWTVKADATARVGIVSIDLRCCRRSGDAALTLCLRAVLGNKVDGIVIISLVPGKEMDAPGIPFGVLPNFEMEVCVVHVSRASSYRSDLLSAFHLLSFGDLYFIQVRIERVDGSDVSGLSITIGVPCDHDVAPAFFQVSRQHDFSNAYALDRRSQI